MVNRKYYSFERNNYYYGKMLTSRDFQNEQSYMNDKRRLVNRLLHGVGIVYGMDVIEADDSSHCSSVRAGTGCSGKRDRGSADPGDQALYD